MDNPQGRIESFVSDGGGTRAVVGVDAAAACPRCAAGKGCGAGLFGAGVRPHRVEATVPAGIELAEGDLVELALAPDKLLRAALVVYGLPLAGGVLAAAIAYALGLGDVGGALAALGGLGAGLVAGRRRLRREACLSRFVPTVARRLPGSAAGD